MGERQGNEDLWALAYPRLVGWTIKRHRLAQEDAEEVVQGAIAQLYEAEVDVGSDLKGVLDATGSRINGIMSNRRTKKIDRIINPTSDGTLPDRHDGRDPEARIAGRQWASHAITLLLERVQGDETLEGVVMNGDAKPKDVAAELGVEVAAVYNARRRLKAHVAAVRDELGGSES